MLAFARYSLMETAIIAINLSDKNQRFYVDLDRLMRTYQGTLTDTSIIVLESILGAQTNELSGSGD